MKKLLAIWLLACVAAFASAQEGTEQNLAFEYFRNGEYEKAAGLFMKLYDKNPSPANYRYLYNSLLYTRHYEELEKIIRRNIKKEESNPVHRVDLGYFYIQQGNLSKGKDEYAAAIKMLQPVDGQVVQLASAFMNFNELELAAKTYERGREIMGVPGMFALELANIYEKLNNPQKAIENYLHYLDQGGSNAQTVRNLLQNVVQQKEFADELHSQLLSRIQKFPEAIYYSEMLIWHYTQIRNYKAAIIQAKALDRRLKENGYRLVNIARSATAEKDFSAATEAYQYVIDKGRTSAMYMPARQELLTALKQKITDSITFSQEDLDHLDNEFDKFIAEFGINSGTAATIREKAELQAFYLNNYDEAIALLESIINNMGIEPQVKGEFKLELGDFYIMKGEIWEAALLYGQVDKSFMDEPLGELARFRQAKLSYYNGEFEWAQAQLDILKSSTTELISNDAIKLSVFIMDNLGLDTTTWPMLKFAHADLLFYQHKTDSSLITVDSVLNKLPGHALTDDIYYLKSNIYLYRKDYTAAAGLLEKIIAEYPEDLLADDATYRLAEINESVFNDKEKAKQLYQDLIFKYQDSVYIIEARKRFRTLRGDQL